MFFAFNADHRLSQKVILSFEIHRWGSAELCAGHVTILTQLVRSDIFFSVLLYSLLQLREGYIWTVGSLRSSENVPSRYFRFHFSTIPLVFSLKIWTNYLGVKFGWAVWRTEKKNWKIVAKYSSHPHNYKTGNFTSYGRERLRNVQKWKMHTCKACKTTGAVSSCQICKFVSSWLRQHLNCQSGETDDWQMKLF